MQFYIQVNDNQPLQIQDGFIVIQGSRNKKISGIDSITHVMCHYQKSLPAIFVRQHESPTRLSILKTILSQ